MAEKFGRMRAFFVSEGTTVEDDVIKNVVFLGPESKNGNDYTPEAMKEAARIYEGMGIYVDHDPKAKSRKTHERFGHAVNVRFNEKERDGKPRVRGDIPYLSSHPMAAAVVESIKKGFGYFGISHVADCLGRKRADGRKTIESIEKVHYLDLVDGAATSTLVEQEDEPMPTPVVDPAQAMKEGLKQMVCAVIDGEGTNEEKVAKIKALLDGAEGNAPTETPPAATPEAAAEQRIVKAVLAGVGATIEQTVKKTVADQLKPVDEKIAGIVEQAKQALAKDRKYTAPAGDTGTPGAGTLPKDPKKLAGWLKSKDD